MRIGFCSGGVGSVGSVIWGDLDFRCLGMAVCGSGMDECGFVLDLWLWFSWWVDGRGYETLCHDVWIMGSLSEWGLFFGIRFW